VLERAFSQAASFPTSPLNAEEILLLDRAGAAAAGLLDVLQRTLTPVDQEPIPALNLNNAFRTEATVNETKVVLELLAHTVINGENNQLVVSKGSPIPPTFSIPSVQFPGITPVAKLAAGQSSHGNAASDAAVEAPL
jgi:hypothetical protein